MTVLSEFSLKQLNKWITGNAESDAVLQLPKYTVCTKTV